MRELERRGGRSGVGGWDRDFNAGETVSNLTMTAKLTTYLLFLVHFLKTSNEGKNIYPIDLLAS